MWTSDFFAVKSLTRPYDDRCQRNCTITAVTVQQQRLLYNSGYSVITYSYRDLQKHTTIAAHINLTEYKINYTRLDLTKNRINRAWLFSDEIAIVVNMITLLCVRPQVRNLITWSHNLKHHNPILDKTEAVPTRQIYDTLWVVTEKHIHNIQSCIWLIKTLSDFVGHDVKTANKLKTFV